MFNLNTLKLNRKPSLLLMFILMVIAVFVMAHELIYNKQKQSDRIANSVILTANVTTAFAFIVLAHGIQTQQKDREAQAFSQLADELTKAEFREKLAFINSCEPDELLCSRLDYNERQIVEDVTGRHQVLGFRLRHNMVPREMVFELLWHQVLSAAQQTWPHILEQRQMRGENYPDDLKYRSEFEWLARECKLYHLDKLKYKLTEEEKQSDLDELIKILPLTRFPSKAQGIRKDDQEA